MGWNEKINRLRDRELPTVEVTIATDSKAKAELEAAQAALEEKKAAAWLTCETPEQVNTNSEVMAAAETVATAEANLKASALILRFKTLPADVMETLRAEAFKGTEDPDQRFINLTKRIMVAAYIPEDGEEITLMDVENLAHVLTDGEWKNLQSAVLVNSQNNELTWETVGKD